MFDFERKKALTVLKVWIVVKSPPPPPHCPCCSIASVLPVDEFLLPTMTVIFLFVLDCSVSFNHSRSMP